MPFKLNNRKNDKYVNFICIRKRLFNSKADE